MFWAAASLLLFLFISTNILLFVNYRNKINIIIKEFLFKVKDVGLMGGLLLWGPEMFRSGYSSKLLKAWQQIYAQKN